MLKIWGRATSANVMKPLWACDEMGVPYEHEEVGGSFGRTKDADYLAMNPNSRVPTIVDDGFVLWESNAIVRYLANKHGRGTMAPADPQDPPDHHHQDRGLDAEERRPDQRQIGVAGVQRRQPQHDQRTRQHEQHARDHAAADAVHQPADIDRELLRLRPRQQHAVVERVQEPALVDPALLLDQGAVHQGDLSGRPAEAQQADPHPGPGGFAEAHNRAGLGGGGVGGGHRATAAGVAAGQLWVSAAAKWAQA